MSARQDVGRKVGTKTRYIAPQDLGVALDEQVVAVFAHDLIYDLAAKAPRSPIGAAMETYPISLWFGIHALNDVFTSNRSAATQLHSRVASVWTLIRETVAAKFPDRPDLHLPDTPPCRTWYHKTRARIIEAHMSDILEEFTARSAEIALDLGLCDPDGSGSHTAPSLDRMLYANGKIITPITNNPKDKTRTVERVDTTTGEVTLTEVPVRHDPDAKNFVDGARRQVHGNKFLQISVRTEHPNERVVLAVTDVPSDKNANNSENHKVVEHATRIAPLLPGVLGIVTDGVLRGADRDRVIRSTGWLVINRPAADAVDKVTGHRTEKEAPYQQVTFGASPDERTVDTYLLAGGLHHKVVDGDGVSHLVPLTRTKNEARANTDGTWRDYVVYEVPDPQGGPAKTLRVRTTNHPDDAINHAELVHQIPVHDPLHDALYSRRQDAESIHRALDDHLPLRRARSYGRRRQLLDLLGHAVRVNTQTVALAAQRRRPVAA